MTGFELHSFHFGLSLNKQTNNATVHTRSRIYDTVYGCNSPAALLFPKKVHLNFSVFSSLHESRDACLGSRRAKNCRFSFFVSF